MLCEELTLSASESPPSRPHLKRPRGSLWNLVQGSTIPPQHIALPRTFNQPDCVSDLTEDEADESQDEGSSTSSILSNSKRRRISRELDGFRTTVGHEDSVTTNRPSILLLSPGLHCDFSQLMSAPSGAQSAPEVITPRNLTSAKHEDWKILKNLAVKAFKQYDACIGTETGTDSCVEALTSMRELLQRCHRFLLVHYDPESAPSFSEIVSPSFPLHGTATSPIDYEPHLPSHRKRHHEPPTAFHAILGMSLFFLGNILARHPTLSLPDEPTTLTHWFTALDVFALGDNLPAHTDGHYADLNEDWQMAIIWGLALIALAKHSLSTATSDPMSSTSLNLTADDPRWPLDSLFGAIAARRSPFTQRMILCKASTDELMMLAMDQLMRGILHMPRQFTPSMIFSRERKLFIIASEVLDVTERLHSPEKQQYWAKWTTSVLDLMNLDEDEDLWGVNVNMARERCSSLLKKGNVSASEDEDKMQEVESHGPSEDVVSDKAISHLSDATTGCPSQLLDVLSDKDVDMRDRCSVVQEVDQGTSGPDGDTGKLGATPVDCGVDGDVSMNVTERNTTDTSSPHPDVDVQLDHKPDDQKPDLPILEMVTSFHSQGDQKMQQMEPVEIGNDLQDEQNILSISSAHVGASDAASEAPFSLLAVLKGLSSCPLPQTLDTDMLSEHTKHHTPLMETDHNGNNSGNGQGMQQILSAGTGNEIMDTIPSHSPSSPIPIAPILV